MHPLWWVILAAALVLLWALFCHWVFTGPRPEAPLGLAYRLVQVYARLVHRVRVEGAEHIPREREPGGLVVVCNHTAGVDPLLVQSAVPFEIRWMMATDMRLPQFEWVWSRARIISVNRGGRDGTGARDAIRHVKAGGVLGVFPEGGIARPRGVLFPFHPGVGLIIARTGAPVLPVAIRGTPDADRAWGSLWKPSRATVTFGPLRRFDPADRPQQIADALRAWFAATTGWQQMDDSPQER